MLFVKSTFPLLDVWWCWCHTKKKRKRKTPTGVQLVSNHRKVNLFLCKFMQNLPLICYQFQKCEFFFSTIASSNIMRIWTIGGCCFTLHRFQFSWKTLLLIQAELIWGPSGRKKEGKGGGSCSVWARLLSSALKEGVNTLISGSVTPKKPPTEQPWHGLLDEGADGIYIKVRPVIGAVPTEGKHGVTGNNVMSRQQKKTKKKKNTTAFIPNGLLQPPVQVCSATDQC